MEVKRKISPLFRNYLLQSIPLIGVDVLLVMLMHLLITKDSISYYGGINRSQGWISLVIRIGRLLLSLYIVGMIIEALNSKFDIFLKVRMKSNKLFKKRYIKEILTFGFIFSTVQFMFTHLVFAVDIKALEVLYLYVDNLLSIGILILIYYGYECTFNNQNGLVVVIILTVLQGVLFPTYPIITQTMNLGYILHNNLMSPMFIISIVIKGIVIQVLYFIIINKGEINHD